VLARRTRLSFLNAQAALEALPKVIDIMTEELHWDRHRQDLEWNESKSPHESRTHSNPPRTPTPLSHTRARPSTDTIPPQPSHSSSPWVSRSPYSRQRASRLSSTSSTFLAPWNGTCTHATSSPLRTTGWPRPHRGARRHSGAYYAGGVRSNTNLYY
jgi:hypothetical protein